MIYRHMKTGALIEPSGTISGGHWMPFESESQEEIASEGMKVIHLEKETDSEETLVTSDDVDLDAMTIDELKEFARKNQIKINAKARKNDLVEAIAAVIY